MQQRTLRAAPRSKSSWGARANRVFCTDEKRIRTENTVLVKSNNGLGLLLSKIADCARTRFSSVRNRRSARTGRRPRKLQALPQQWARCRAPRMV
jgi:hypothetical protein